MDSGVRLLSSNPWSASWKLNNSGHDIEFLCGSFASFVN